MLADIRANGRQRNTQCPAHEDHRASLSVGLGDDGRVLVHCHAGCTVEAVLAACDLSMADLMPEGKPAGRRQTKGKIVATYDYKDEDGILLYQVVRFQPKRFVQRRPDRNGGWIYNMNGVRRVIYQLPRLRHMVAGATSGAGQPDIIICEGEKDSDALMSLGIAATTNVGGAAKWRDDYTRQLVGIGVRSVAVLPDNDDAGRQHAESVARSCHAAGLAAKIVALPGLRPKGDVSDFLQRAGVDSLAQLQECVAAAAPYPPPRSLGSTASVDLATALSDVENFIRTYVVLAPEAAILIALWIAQTFALDAFDYVAYLHVTSPVAECGKTRLLEVLQALVAKPWLTGRVTAAVLMRKVDAERPVLLLDESDAAFKGEPVYAEALRGMLNTGFSRSGKASICVGQGANVTYKDFSTFAPKAIAGIGKLPSTVESRSIPVALRRRTKDERVAKWRARDGWAKAEPLRGALTSAMAGALATLGDARPQLPDGLSDRAEDVLEPLFAIADGAGNDWPERAREAAVCLMGCAARVAQESDQNIGLELLADIQAIFQANENPEEMPTRQIIAGLEALEDRPWATFRHDKPITGHRLARLLKTFDVHPGGTLRNGKKTFKGYRQVAFADAFARYLPSKGSHGNSPNEDGVQPQKTEASHTASVTDPKSEVPLDKDWPCDAVTLSGPHSADDEAYYGA
jgi:hypothetical protein